MDKILILVGGGTSHLKVFEKNAKELGLDLMTASFSDISYLTKDSRAELFVKDIPIDNFSVIYIRLVGKRYEDLSLLVACAKQKNIKVVDEIYAKGDFVRLPLVKSVESKLLYEGGILTPKTFYGSLNKIAEQAPKIFGYPFVIKGTTGKQGHAVWSPRNTKELEELTGELKLVEKQGKRFIAQEFIKASQRIRVFVVGGKALAAITRPTRWRKRFTNKEALRAALMPVPKKEAQIALKACQALSINIAGVDVIKEDATGKLFVLEVNSAPCWASISADTGLNVEAEILKYLASLV